MRLLSLIVASLIALPLVAAPARIVRPGAEIRADVGFSGAVLARPAQGATVDLLEARNEWRRVQLADGTSGWVHELFVQRDAPAPGGEIALPAPVETPTAVPAPSDDDVAVGRLREEIARLRTELSAQTMRADTAQRAADEADARAASAELRIAQAESVRDEALAKAQVAQAGSGVPEDLIEKIRSDTQREADERCAHDMAVQVEDAVADAMKTLTSSEAEQARVDKAVEERTAILKAQHDVEMQACRNSRASAPAPAPAPPAGDASEVARLTKALEDEKAAHAADVQRVEDENEKLHDTYVEIVTQRHEEALQRERDAAAAECDRKITEERRVSDRQIRSARKESGWEEDFETELRERTKLAVEEAQSRWEAKQRGEAYDEQRVRKDEEERVRKACDAERLSAVQAAVAEQLARDDQQRRQEREEADTRCQVALEVVLEKAAAGEDLSSIRAFAREKTRAPAPAAP